MTLDFDALYTALAETPLKHWRRQLPDKIAEGLSTRRHGDLGQWLEVLEALPALAPSQRVLDADTVRIGAPGDCDDATRERLRAQLGELHPWRKGPFEVFGIPIDTEWRSDWKWRRLQDAIEPLRDRLVLDVGCGNGYFGWRMVGAGARLVLGLDPSPKFNVQFHALKHFLGDTGNWVLPLGAEAMPDRPACFDTVFSMGVLYHRRSPMDHLLQLRGCLARGGELVLETLVVDGGPREVLVPEGRYAQMPNVWFIPSCEALRHWLYRCGYEAVTLLDVTATTTAEQRATEWMTFHSLADFLDAQDPERTVEGLPAPKRALLTAKRP